MTREQVVALSILSLGDGYCGVYFLTYNAGCHQGPLFCSEDIEADIEDARLCSVSQYDFAKILIFEQVESMIMLLGLKHMLMVNSICSC